MKAKDTLHSNMQRLTRLKGLESDHAMCVKVWDMRVERLRAQHKLELAITAHFIRTRGDVGSETIHSLRELESVRQKVDAEQKALQAYGNLQIQRAERVRQEKENNTLARVLGTWESNFDRIFVELLQELQRGVSVREALQRTGLICPCDDVNCQFPFVVEESHALL